MKPEELTDRLSAASLPARCKFLNLMSYHLTIAARDISDDALEAKARLAAINEMQHTLIGQLGHYLDGEEVKVYPLDVFSKILFGKAAAHQLVPALVGSINFAQRHSSKS
jgi:hypothetical protein